MPSNAREELTAVFLDATDDLPDDVAQGIDALLARRELLLEALGGEERTPEETVTKYEEDEMGWRMLPVAIQRYDVWRFPVVSGEQEENR